MMLNVRFYEETKDENLKFAVIISRYQGKWVLCKHRKRDTYEFPGGHREDGETIEEAAKRELYEETGALTYEMEPVCVYSVEGKNPAAADGEESFGMLYFAEIDTLGGLPPLEIERVEFFRELPDNWTYPEIQPKLMEQFINRRTENRKGEYRCLER